MCAADSCVCRLVGEATGPVRIESRPQLLPLSLTDATHFPSTSLQHHVPHLSRLSSPHLTAQMKFDDSYVFFTVYLKLNTQQERCSVHANMAHKLYCFSLYERLQQTNSDFCKGWNGLCRLSSSYLK